MRIQPPKVGIPVLPAWSIRAPKQDIDSTLAESAEEMATGLLVTYLSPNTIFLSRRDTKFQHITSLCLVSARASNRALFCCYSRRAPSPVRKVAA
ncbi:hypothetical protein PRUPE_8G052900 [Prunus persica]|uniref:Uncharacterized protein n=1 Tax=Prunus persica TaxID=3760 RepID=M5W0A2_PRUPE|nr:hypothetical protein PRUPE_8G052900 [Prunus persica]